MTIFNSLCPLAFTRTAKTFDEITSLRYRRDIYFIIDATIQGKGDAPMTTKQGTALISLCVLLMMFTVGLAEGADGTLKVAFKYKDPTTGVEQKLLSGFIYLHDAKNPPPMEKFYSKADYIDGVSNYADGVYTKKFPAGTYYIRITQRKNVGGTTIFNRQGPPQVGDYTWFQTSPITITAGQTLDLGTKYANIYSSSPVTITGTVRTQKGVPLAGQFVRAQTEPCYADGYNYNINSCGPNKFIALEPTDANGQYTLFLREPGTYYLYTSPCLTPAHFEYSGNRCGYTAAPAPITVRLGDKKSTDFVVFRYP